MNIRQFNQNIEGTFYAAFETRQEIHRSVCELIAAGVFERHPDLRVVAAEAGIEYAANLERRLDSGYTSFWKRFGKPVDDAVGVLPPERVPHLHQRSARAEQPALHRRRPLHVVG